MYKDIEKQKILSKEKRVYSLQAVSQLDFFPYMDQLAGLIGCKPNFCMSCVKKNIIISKVPLYFEGETLYKGKMRNSQISIVSVVIFFFFKFNLKRTD
jgi:hypothetical protein